MKKPVVRYILFQLPEIILTILLLQVIYYFYCYPLWIFWIIISAFIIKDIVLFYKTWPAYVVHKEEEFTKIKGKTGIANADFDKTGYLNINGELWKAVVNEPVKKGDSLIVTDVKGLMLKASRVS
jgi:membrane protein implicated in regulation of membrane protease activity